MIKKEFIASYNREKPKHPGFIAEMLTRINSSHNLPEAMRSLPIGSSETSVTYLNIARWRSAEDFRDHFKPRTMHDPEIESSDRLRAVFEVIDLES